MSVQPSISPSISPSVSPAGIPPAWFGPLQRHSLAWLVVGNAVGVLMAVLLLAPELGYALGSVTYGRIMPVHLNAQLYGWCSLPAVGLLFRMYLPADDESPWPARAVRIWSGILLFGCVTWLGGHASGKLFLEWEGPARVLLVVGFGVLATVLIHGYRRRPRETRLPAAVKWVFLAGLCAIPAVMALATSTSVYPPINPDSGGPTGLSFMGSSLVIVAVLLACPPALRLQRRGGSVRVPAVFGILAVHFLVFLLADHGDHSHHDPFQLACMLSLGIWPPLLYWYFRGFVWPFRGGRWLGALAAWGLFLMYTSILLYWPGVLDRIKFTNMLVGHTHAAMGGLLTMFNVMVLIALGRGGSRVFDRPLPFWLWQIGLLAHVLALKGLGWVEAAHLDAFFGGGALVTAVYAVRLVAGTAMFGASAQWLHAAIREGVPA
jgi:cytochrome c oxidase cbb3-type subunit 1